MLLRRLLPQRQRILFVVALVVVRLAIYSIFLFKFFVLMTLPQSIMAYVATLAIVMGIWKLAGWYEPKERAGGSKQDGPIVHPLVGAPGQFADGPVAPAPITPEPSAPAPAATPAVPATPAVATMADTAAAPISEHAATPAPADVAVNIFAVPTMHVTSPVLAAEPAVVVPVQPTAPHESAAALVEAMGSTWPTTAGPSFERPLPAWTPPPTPQFSGARA